MAAESEQSESSGNIHDKTFGLQFRRRSEYRALIRLIFSEEDLSFFDLRTLRLEMSRWTLIEDDMLRDREADLVLSVRLKIGRRVEVRIIVEHKSFDDRDLIPQLFCYQIACYQQGAEAVLPVIVYHGEKPLPVRSRTFQEYKKSTALPERFVDRFSDVLLNFGVLLVDLTDEITYDRLDELPVTSRLTLQTMGKIWTATPQTWLEIVDQSEELEREVRFDLIRRLAVYISEVHGLSCTIETMIDLVNKRRRGGRKMAHRIAEEWSWVTRHDLREPARLEGLEEGLQKGLQKGRQKGRQEGRQETVIAIAGNLIAKGMPVQEISAVTGLSSKQIDELRSDS